MVAACRGLNGVGGDLDIAIGSVLEADRCRQARGQFTVNLALGGAGTNGPPRDQITQVLGRDDVQELTAGRQPGAVDLNQQLARNTQALINAEGLIQVRIIDEPFPADRGAGLLKVHPHHDLQRVGVFLALHLELARIVQRGCGVMNRARANHHQQPVVCACHDVVNILAGAADQRLDRGALNGEKAD